MNDSFSTFSMYPYRLKVLGLLISLISLIFMLFISIKKITPFLGLEISQLKQLADLLFIFGIIIIAYCREKKDDDRVKLVRLKSLQFTFLITLSMIMAISFVSIILNKRDLIDVQTIIYILLFVLIVYLTTFYIGLYKAWNYSRKVETF